MNRQSATFKRRTGQKGELRETLAMLGSQINDFCGNETATLVGCVSVGKRGSLETVNFKQQNGRVMVPQSLKGLGRWVRNQSEQFV